MITLKCTLLLEWPSVQSVGFLFIGWNTCRLYTDMFFFSVQIQAFRKGSKNVKCQNGCNLTSWRYKIIGCAVLQLQIIFLKPLLEMSPKVFRAVQQALCTFTQRHTATEANQKSGILFSSPNFCWGFF